MARTARHACAWDEVVARLAERQHGVVAARQLAAIVIRPTSATRIDVSVPTAAGRSLNPSALERALDEAEVKQLYDRTSLDAVARAHPGERDRERDAILARAGYRVLRFSHRQLTREPPMVAHTLRSSA